VHTHARGPSKFLYYQLVGTVEQLIRNQQVGGSIPLAGSLPSWSCRPYQPGIPYALSPTPTSCRSTFFSGAREAGSLVQTTDGTAVGSGTAGRGKTSYSGPNWARNSKLKARNVYQTGRVTTVPM